tara:strand:- start:4794 stop:5207 length:414 start_codon:yes stop_codon:yes gene_type:complete
MEYFKPQLWADLMAPGFSKLGAGVKKAFTPEQTEEPVNDITTPINEPIDDITTPANNGNLISDAMNALPNNGAVDSFENLNNQQNQWINFAKNLDPQNVQSIMDFQRGVMGMNENSPGWGQLGPLTTNRLREIQGMY